MTKKEFVRTLADKTNLNMKDIRLVLEKFQEVVEDVVREQDELVVPGVCRISTKFVPERRGINRMGAAIGEEWVKPAHYEPVIKVAGSLKNILE